MKIEIHFIYALKKNGEIFYVGITINPNVRWERHRNTFREGVDIEILDHHIGLREEAYVLESNWIKKIRKDGYKLENKSVYDGDIKCLVCKKEIESNTDSFFCSEKCKNSSDKNRINGILQPIQNKRIVSAVCLYCNAPINQTIGKKARKFCNPSHCTLFHLREKNKDKPKGKIGRPKGAKNKRDLEKSYKKTLDGIINDTENKKEIESATKDFMKNGISMTKTSLVDGKVKVTMN